MPLGAGTQGLARVMASVSHPVRLAILEALQEPRTLSEIAVGPQGRTLARQTVKEHLDRLLETGLVRARQVERGRGAATQYLIDHQRLFAVSEAFREMARLRPSEEVDGPTLPQAPSPAGAPAASSLVLVKGPEEGKVYRLVPPRDAAPAWVIGRLRSADVSLDFDPYVSAENARIEGSRGQGFQLTDLPGSRNGTTLNFRVLRKGVPVELHNGDLVGVGRSYLLFRRPATA